MLYTSYFGNIKNLPKDYTLFSISIYRPKFCPPTVKNLAIFAPKVSFFKEKLEIYEPLYLEVLNSRKSDIDLVIKNLPENSVFLCYESLKKKDEFCHRRLLAEWLLEKYNLEVAEFGKKIEQICIL